MTARAAHDFETGAVVDIKKAGADAYAADEHTHVQCMAYRLPGKATTVWMRGDPDPTEFLDYVEDGGELSAFNAPFEWAVWHRTISRQYPHWPRPRPEQMFCTMARALALSLPGSLEKCGEALALDVKKDKAGYRLMLKLCRPTAAWRKNPVGPPQWPGTPEEWQRHAEYCRQDVDAEIAIGERIAELSPQERKLWQLDLRINQRGILLDLPKVQAAITIASAETKRLSAELRAITDKAVPAVSNPAKLLEWLHTRGVELEDARKRTLNLALSQHPLLRLDPATGRATDAAARRAVEIRREAGKASVAKLRAMLACVNADGRARGLLRYHAATTGRWCLTGDHEVLTPRGWQRLDEWAGGRLMCWSENGRMGFEDGAANTFRYDGDLIKWDSARFQQLATPEHRMPVVGVTGGIALGAMPNRPKVPRTGVTGCSSRYSDAQLRCLIMTQADGCYQANGCVSFNFAKSRKVVRCKMLLRWAGIPFDCKKHKNVIRITVRDRHVPAWLRVLGPKKDFPWELLFADHDQFFEELEMWDAYRCGPQSVQYSTTNKHNADFVQAKAHISGRACNVVLKRKAAGNWSDAYSVNIWLKPGPAEVRKEHISRVGFAGTVYCPTTPTGYFLVRRGDSAWITGNSGSRIQIQNFPRPTLDEETIRGVIEVMGSPHDADTIANCYADPIPAISSSLRALIVPGKGNVFIGGDLSGIEDRGNAWLAGERWKLDAFRALDAGKGVDLYLLTYARSFGVDIAKLPPKGQERQVGKVTSLACGYAGGPFALLSMSMVLEVDVATIAAAMQRITHPADWEAVKDKQPKDLRGLNEDTWAGLKIAVDAYRKGHPAIKEFWSDLEGCAFDAVRYPGRMFTIASGLVKFAATKSFLFCQLPSGRCLAYARPSIEWVNRAGERVERGSKDAYKEAVFYWGVGKKSKRWERRKLTVPTLAENTVSGTSRDVLVGGMMRAEERGYRIVMHVHDELLAEVPKGFGSAEEFKEIMTEPLPWMKGLPVNASTWQSDRYVKG